MQSLIEDELEKQNTDNLDGDTKFKIQVIELENGDEEIVTSKRIEAIMKNFKNSAWNVKIDVDSHDLSPNKNKIEEQTNIDKQELIFF